MHDEICATLTKWGVPSHVVPHLALTIEAIIRGRWPLREEEVIWNVANPLPPGGINEDHS